MKTRFFSTLLAAVAATTASICSTTVEAKAFTTDFDPIPAPNAMQNADGTPTALLNAITNNFVQDERAFLDNADFFELDASTLTFASDVNPVEIFFINEGAGITTNDLLVSISGGAQQTVFGDISCSVGCELGEDDGMYTPGDGVSLGFQPAGTSFDLTLNVLNFFNYTASGEANLDGLQHIVAFEFGEFVIVGFEDLYGPLGATDVDPNTGIKNQNSDRDFNDVVFAIRGVTANQVSLNADEVDVPEPSAMLALFGLGAFGLFGLRRHQF